MKKYRQLTYRDRIYMDVLNFQRRSNGEMAELLGVHRSTITRELRRGCTSAQGWSHCYRAELSEAQNRVRVSKRGRKPKLIGELKRIVVEKIKLGWSPEQISGRLKLDGQPGVSYETIYKFIKDDRDKGGSLYLHLRRGRRRRKKRFSVPRVRSDILNRKHISTRPAIIEQRERIGDWERDLMFGASRSSALLTAVERKSQYTFIRKVKNKSPGEIAKVTKSLFESGVIPCHSITNDNGFEFRYHEQESRDLKIPIYFTNPYSSWEKGTNENINGLIRQYFFNNTNMEKFTDEDAKAIEEALNTRPRKKIGFRTPKEFVTQEKIAINI